MHYHWQILVKADTKDEAEDQLDSIMHSIGGDGRVWDWYDQDGRWKQNTVRATAKSFWDRIEQALNNQRETLRHCSEQAKKILEEKEISLEDYMFSDKLNDNIDTMLGYYLGTIASIKQGDYISQSYFATSDEIWGSSQFTDTIKEQIKKNPKEYWLISVDLHN